MFVLLSIHNSKYNVQKTNIGDAMQIFLRYARNTSYLPNNFVTKAYDCHILFILKGTGKILLEEKEFDLKENTLCYYPSATRYFPTSSEETPMEFITLNFDFDRENSGLVKALSPVSENDFLIEKAIMPNNDSLPDIFKNYFVFENAIEFRDEFIKLTDEFTEDTPISKEKSEAKLQYLLLCLATHSQENSKDIFSEILTYIKNNLLTINSNEEIAQALNYHSYYLNKIFKEKTGTSIHQYIINERLKIAASLLISTSYNISSIAKLSGFENTRHFSTAFRKKYNCTPSTMSKRKNPLI